MQIKNVQQHQAKIHVRSKTRSTNLTANMLDGRGFGEKTESHETKRDNWQVGLKNLAREDTTLPFPLKELVVTK